MILEIHEIVNNPIVIGFVVGAPTIFFGFRALRRGEAMDKRAVATATATEKGDSIQRVIDGLDSIIANLQADNTAYRGEVASLKAGRAASDAAYQSEIASLTQQLKECRAAAAALKEQRSTNQPEEQP